MFTFFAANTNLTLTTHIRVQKSKSASDVEDQTFEKSSLYHIRNTDVSITAGAASTGRPCIRDPHLGTSEILDPI